MITSCGINGEGVVVGVGLVVPGLGLELSMVASVLDPGLVKRQDIMMSMFFWVLVDLAQCRRHGSVATVLLHAVGWSRVVTEEAMNGGCRCIGNIANRGR